MADRECSQCGSATAAADAFCRHCGTANTAAALSATSPILTDRDLPLDGATTIDRSSGDSATDPHRWQSARTLLGLGAVVLAVLIALSALGGFGDSGSGPDEATITESAVNDATPAPEPTARPTATPTPTAIRGPQPDDPDGPAEPVVSPATDNEAEAEQIIAGWDRVTDLFEADGVLVVQSASDAVNIVELATGRWTEFEFDASPTGYLSTGELVFPTGTGVAATDGNQLQLYPWDGSKPIPLGAPNEIVASWSNDVIIVGPEDSFFGGVGPGPRTAYELSSGESKVLNLPGTPNPTQLWGLSRLVSYPFATDTGAGAAFWTFEGGWSDLGPGNLLALSDNGALLESCNVTDDASLSCAMEAVTFDGARTTVNSNVTLDTSLGASLSPDLRWLATIDPDSFDMNTEFSPAYTVTDLASGADVGSDISLVGNSPGIWLGAGEVLAVLGDEMALQLLRPTTGESVVIDDVPWSTGASRTFERWPTFLDVPFAEIAQLAE